MKSVLLLNLVKFVHYFDHFQAGPLFVLCPDPSYSRFCQPHLPLRPLMLPCHSQHNRCPRGDSNHNRGLSRQGQLVQDRRQCPRWENKRQPIKTNSSDSIFPPPYSATALLNYMKSSYSTISNSSMVGSSVLVHSVPGVPAHVSGDVHTAEGNAHPSNIFL